MASRISLLIAWSLAVLLAGTVIVAPPAVAQDVGAAAAVNPLSESTPPGGQSRVLRIGARIMHNERIKTTAVGTVQLLFVDKTTLNIGPNSNLVIDNFVYDPATGTGQMATSLTKGVLRFVGGQISHQGAATVSTPVATIGIRGGTATIMHGKDGTRIINHFGRLTVTTAGGTTTISRTGFAVWVPNHTKSATEPQRASQGEVNQYLDLLTSQRGQNGGAPSIPTEALVGQYGVGQRYGNFGPDTQPIQQQTTNVQNIVGDVIIQGTQKGTVRRVNVPPQPQPRPTPTPPPPPPPPTPPTPLRSD
jgi:FecR protein